MNKNLRTRGIVIGAVVLFSAILMFGPWNKPKEYNRTAADFFSPARLKQNLAENIRLGLDLKGGTHLVLQVQADDAIKLLTEGNADKARTDILKKANIPFKEVKVPANGRIVVETPDTARHGEIRDKLLADFGDYWEASTSSNPPSVTFNLIARAATEIRNQATEQAKTIIEQRIDAFGVAEPTVQRHGRDEDYQILVQMPGVDNPERVKQLIRGTTVLELKAVVPNTQLYPTKEAAEAAMAALPNAADLQVLRLYEPSSGPGDAPREGWHIVEKRPIITGADLRNAQGVPAQQGVGYRVVFSLKPTGADKFEQWTSANINNLLAIVLKDEAREEIKSAPYIKSAIRDSGEIEGSFTQQEAEDLGLVLRSGALPAKIVYLQESTVGPSLGADSIRQGVLASIAGLVFVVGFMLFYYRVSGVNAVIALILNLLLILTGLALFNATLTLPGIAGVILTIGMAVDSNVLIFERIREELRAGKLVASAVDIGFNKALVTIIDTHVTTVVSSLFLYAFGTGPIRGFAVTLVIGLVANLFTAVYVSRTMFMWVLSRRGPRAETISI
jgi:preprotein translocase subunit SecD